MRSNGAAHLGNDTFIISARNSPECCHIYTSHFAEARRTAELPLARQARVHPCSSLLYDEEDVKRFVADHVQQHRTSETPTWEEDWPRFFCRHTMHASPSGRLVAVMSNTTKLHYLVNLRTCADGRGAQVIEFETESVVRATAWQPRGGTKLLLLLATGIISVVSTEEHEAGVVLATHYHVDVRSAMMRTFERGGNHHHHHSSSRDKNDDVKMMKRGAADGFNEEEPPAAGVADAGPTTSTAASQQQQQQQQQQQHHHKGERSGMINDLVAHHRSGAASKTNSVKLDAFGLPVGHSNNNNNNNNTSSLTEGAATTTLNAQTRNTAILPRAKVPAQIAAPHHPTKTEAVVIMPRSNSAAATTQQHHHHHSRGGDVVVGSSSSVVEQQWSEHCRQLHLAGASPSVFSPLPMLGAGYDHHHDQHSCATTSAATSCVAPADCARLRQEREHPSSGVDVVGMTIVPSTRSMPNMLLLLSSSGDVWATHLEETCLPCGEGVDDGRMHHEQPTTTTTSSSSSRRKMFRPAAVVRHLLHLGSPAYDEEALAISATLVDEDTGLHAITTIFSSGVVRGSWVDEPDLLAHDDDHVGTTRTPPRTSFEIALGNAMHARSALSPAVPTTSHVVQVNVRHNVLLVRWLDAAYVVALPRWSLVRGGWTYYEPTTSSSSSSSSKSSSTTDMREVLRLPLVGSQAAVPEPLAFRLPFAVEEASIALGETTILIVPEELRPSSSSSSSSPSSVTRAHVVGLHISSLLQSAMLARSGDLHVDVGGHDAAIAPIMDKLLNHCADVHRSIFANKTDEEIDAATADVAQELEMALKHVQGRERDVAAREARLHQRVAHLLRTSTAMSDKTEEQRTVVLDALVHRRGADAIITANERLGDVHRMLNEMEQQHEQQGTTHEEAKTKLKTERA